MRWREVLSVAAAGVAVYELSSLTFADSVKHRVVRQQNGECDACHKVAKLQVHHRVPWSIGGSNRDKNAVALCEECHLFWDRRTLVERIVYPNIRIDKAPKELFRSVSWRRRAITGH